MCIIKYKRLIVDQDIPVEVQIISFIVSVVFFGVETRTVNLEEVMLDDTDIAIFSK